MFDELARRIERHPPDRFPVQHATAQFHLGTALAAAGRLDEADAALAVACRLFRPDQLPVEHAKAANARGAVQRMAGQLPEAAASFGRAADLFAQGGLDLEEGAARFNLGLVERERDGAGAVEAFEQARLLLDPERVPGQAAAAARELGSALVSAGRHDEAVAVLEPAVELAARAADRPGTGGTANVLGLAHLGAGRPAEAVAAFERALGAHPRSVRPDGYAMAKSNLALALEAAGQPARAGLAAVQALGTPGAPEAVRAQAAGILLRTGAGTGAVWGVLDDSELERWPAVVREELVRWADAAPAERSAEAAAWVEGQLARPVQAEELASAYLAGLLEVPPDAFGLLVRATVDAVAGLGPDDQQRFASPCARAMARFPVPQLLRLKDSFAAAGAERGVAATW
ncbi:MAG: tetratricopeptide repeat protein [Actinomycetota bacterium]